MSQTITKSIGEGFAHNPIYAALAYDSTDHFGGYEIKDVMFNAARKAYFRNTTNHVYSSATSQLDLVGTTVKVTGNLEITGSLSYGSTVVSLDSSLMGDLTVGVENVGYDVIFWGDTGSKCWKWIEESNTMDVLGDVDIEGATALTGALTVSTTLAVAGNTTITAGTLTVGLTTAGTDVKFFGDDTGYEWLWDANGGTGSKGSVIMKGDFHITGLCTHIGALTVGVANTGHDVIFYGDAGSGLWSWVDDQGTNGGVTMKGTWICVGNLTITGATSQTGNIGLIGKLTISPAGTGTFVDFELDTEWTTGTLINADFGTESTYGGSVVGINLDLGANIVATSEQAVTGLDINLPQMTATSLTKALYGIVLTAEGAFTLDGGTCTWDGVNIAMPAQTQTSGSLITSGLQVTGGTLSSGTRYGLFITAACTDGVQFSGACTNYINFNNVGSTAATALHFKDAYLGMVIETGTYSSVHSTGITLDATNCRPVSFLFDDNDAALGGGCYRPVLSRVFLDADQDQGIALHCIRGQLVVKADVNLNIASNYWDAMDSVDGYVQILGETDIGALTRVSCVHATMQITGNMTVTSGGRIAGFFAEMASITAVTVTKPYPVGLLIDKLDPLHLASQRTWETGIYIVDGSCVTGIKIGLTDSAGGENGILIDSNFTAQGAAAHKAIESNVTYTPATSGTGVPIAIAGKVTLAGSQTHSGLYMWGVQGGLYFSASSTLASSQVAAGRFVLEAEDDTVTWTSGNIACIYCDNLIDEDISGIAGEADLIRLANHGTGMDNAINVYGPFVTNLFLLGGCSTGGMVSAASASALHGTLSKKIKISIDGVTYYLLASTTPT